MNPDKKHANKLTNEETAYLEKIKELDEQINHKERYYIKTILWSVFLIASVLGCFGTIGFFISGGEAESFALGSTAAPKSRLGAFLFIIYLKYFSAYEAITIPCFFVLLLFTVREIIKGKFFKK